MTVFIYPPPTLREEGEKKQTTLSKHLKTNQRKTGFPSFKQMLFTHNPFPRSHLETGSVFLSIHLETWNFAGTSDIHLLLASDKCRASYAFTSVSLCLGDITILTSYVPFRPLLLAEIKLVEMCKWFLCRCSHHTLKPSPSAGLCFERCVPLARRLVHTCLVLEAFWMLPLSVKIDFQGWEVKSAHCAFPKACLVQSWYWASIYELGSPMT